MEEIPERFQHVFMLRRGRLIIRLRHEGLEEPILDERIERLGIVRGDAACPRGLDSCW